MTFPHTHKKRMSLKMEAIKAAANPKICPECFIFASRLVLRTHKPTCSAQKSTRELLGQAIMNLYECLPDSMSKPNKDALPFKQWAVSAHVEDLVDLCLVIKPGIHPRYERQIKLLLKDIQLQNQHNRNKHQRGRSRWKKKR